MSALRDQPDLPYDPLYCNEQFGIDPIVDPEIVCLPPAPNCEFSVVETLLKFSDCFLATDNVESGVTKNFKTSSSLRCSFCDKVFSEQLNLNSHLSIHPEETQKRKHYGRGKRKESDKMENEGSGEKGRKKFKAGICHRHTKEQLP